MTPRGPASGCSDGDLDNDGDAQVRAWPAVLLSADTPRTRAQTDGPLRSNGSIVLRRHDAWPAGGTDGRSLACLPLSRRDRWHSATATERASPLLCCTHYTDRRPRPTTARARLCLTAPLGSLMRRPRLVRQHIARRLAGTASLGTAIVDSRWPGRAGQWCLSIRPPCNRTFTDIVFNDVHKN